MPCSCPVPPEQRPLREYEQLADSWFFRWAQTRDQLLRRLTLCWLALLPLTLVVAGGSVVLRHHPAQLLLSGAAWAVMLPLLLLVRQWLGWRYVHRRLVSERVEYEESGWYDGQVWEKPLSWRQQDLLVARHQVGPVLARLRRGIALATALLLMGVGVCQAL
ncbi:MAG: CGLD27 family protein [Cyanobacteriota bacterium]|nr:CGLD27 family protein [Cyanobacteriota bacterium]